MVTIETIESLYELFGVSSTCPDEELRRAYHRVIFKHHPDRNPKQFESATAITKRFTTAYDRLKKHRSGYQSKDTEIDINEWENTGFGVGIVPPYIDLKDITKRKTDFRNEWFNFRKNPTDVLCALKLIQAAFMAERQDSVMNLLLNSILIDSAALLLSFASDKKDACETLIRWAEVLRENQRKQEAIQILEDSYITTDQVFSSLSEKLRFLHYSFAQDIDSITGIKVMPRVRIEHLNRILELGFKYDYIYKLLAEAYYDLADNKQARECLNQAYKLNPKLSGAVRISRALGFLRPSDSLMHKTMSSNRYKYSHPEQIPPVAKLREWLQQGDWNAIINFSNPNDYSPNILPMVRRLLRQIAIFLEKCKDPRTIEALISLLNFNYYWDVSEAAMTSLSKIGDQNVLELIEKIRPGNSREQEHRINCISYIQARINNQSSMTTSTSLQSLLSEAKLAYEKKNYGKARLLLENLLLSIEQEHFLYFDAVIYLARSCAKMNDTAMAIELVKPIFTKLPKNLRLKISPHLALWLWEDLVFQEYTHLNDAYYQLALEIHLELILISKTPYDAFKHLKLITRWLELVGVEDTAQWIREFIRIEVPGTMFVDSYDRKQYFRHVKLNQIMKDYLSSFDKRIKTDVTIKLKQLIGSPLTLKNTQLLLNRNTTNKFINS